MPAHLLPLGGPTYSRLRGKQVWGAACQLLHPYSLLSTNFSATPQQETPVPELSLAGPGPGTCWGGGRIWVACSRAACQQGHLCDGTHAQWDAQRFGITPLWL